MHIIMNKRRFTSTARSTPAKIEMHPDGKSVTALHFLFAFALLLALWFLLTGWFWYWTLNLTITYPAGILALVLALIGRSRDPRRKRYSFILWTLAAGLVNSLSWLAYALAYEF
jgi:hypothetical protein